MEDDSDEGCRVAAMMMESVGWQWWKVVSDGSHGVMYTNGNSGSGGRCMGSSNGRGRQVQGWKAGKGGRGNKNPISYLSF